MLEMKKVKFRGKSGCLGSSAERKRSKPTDLAQHLWFLSEEQGLIVCKRLDWGLYVLWGGTVVEEMNLHRGGPVGREGRVVMVMVMDHGHAMVPAGLVASPSRAGLSNSNCNFVLFSWMFLSFGFFPL